MAGLELEDAVRIIPRSQIDMRLMRDWLTDCLHNPGHIACNRDQASNLRLGEDTLLLVDVQDRCIVRRAAQTTDYVALSYVWGNIDQYLLTRAGLPDLLKPGALDGCSLSQTIKDAMTFITGLGERYLWVDTLCIIQDDSERKQAAIKNMGYIYSQALCTLVAVWATDNTSGLPGVRAWTRKPGITAEILGDELTLSIPSDDPWIYQSRGWTYQEYLLSHHRFNFGGPRVEFVCQHAYKREDRVHEQVLDQSEDHWGEH